MAIVKKTWKTKKPTGLAISRDGNYFKCTWKIGDKDYGARHIIGYWRNWDSKKKKGDRYPKDNYEMQTVVEVDKKTKKKVKKKKKVQIYYYVIGAGVTAKNMYVNPMDYYPHKKKYLNNVYFGVSGRRKPFKEEVKKGGKTTTYQYSTVSNGDWIRKGISLKVPNKPRVASSLSDEFENTTIFSWVSSSHGDKNTVAWFTDYEWQSMLLIDSNVTDGKKLTWKKKTGSKSNFWFEGTGTGQSKIITEEYIGDEHIRTRWFRVRARGPKGASEWTYTKHVYSLSNRATGVAVIGTELASRQGYQIKVNWSSNGKNGAQPIDKTVIEYAIGVPNSSHSTSSGIVKTTLSLMDNPSWEQVGSLKDTTGQDSYIFYIGRLLNPDECIWVRVNNHHDKRETPGLPTFVEEGKWKDTYANKNFLTGILAKPTVTNITPPDPTTNRITVTVDNSQNTISSTFTAIYFKTSQAGSKEQLVGIIPAGQSSATIQLPEFGDYQIAIGAKAYIADYSPATPSSTKVTSYSITNIKMESPGISWDGYSIPLPPTNVVLTNPTNGTVRVSWDWTWTSADGAELSWSDSKDAWESTNEPQVYQVRNTHVGAWNIAGLDIGTWYIRVRLYKDTGDSRTYGGYSDIKDIKLASAPLTPLLTLSEDVIPSDGEVTCYWVYTSTDGTSQMSAEVCEAFIDENGAVTYGSVIAKADTSQKLTIDARTQNWGVGETHHLSVRVASASGEKSEDWSLPMQVRIAEKPIVTVSSTSLVERTETINPDVAETDPEAVPETRTYLALTAMPLSATILGAGTDGDTTLIIERAEDYHMERPDGSIFDGYDGETIALASMHGEGEFTINQNDERLIGLLDDGAKYNLIAIVRDTYGQVVETVVPFEVWWDHQALMPSADISAVQNEYYTLITPLAPVHHIPTNDESVVADKEYFYRRWSGDGVNIIPQPYSDEPQTINGISFTVNSNGSVTANGTATDDVIFWIKSAESEEPLILEDRTYVLSGCPIGGDISTYCLQAEYGAETVYGVDSGTGEFFLGNSEAPAAISIRIRTGIEVENLIFNPKLEIKETEDDDLYEYIYVENPSSNPKTAGYYEVESVAGDRCDIYRLSADIPQLIIKNAEFGRQYIDPYPTLGTMGGHRIVYMTINGDYITSDNHAAWIDYDQDDDNKIDIFATIIDFDNKQIVLPYDIELSSSWKKDFTETHYLGGSVQGDWNPSVSRSGSVKSNVIVFEDPDNIRLMRELADYPGICHIRTPDGSSYTANIDVTEDRENRFINKKASFSLSITRVDSDRYDGMLYEEWVNEHKEFFITE